MEKTKDGRMVDTIGEFVLHSPAIPDREAFLNGHITRKKDQKFEHTNLPTVDEYDNWPEYKRNELIAREDSRRADGVWFYNCGTPTYITGNHYYFLNYHRFGGQKPDFREADRRFFWVWKHCLEAPNCFGLFIHTRRRYGKTGKGASIGLEAVTRVPFLRCGIQSKTEKDAKEVYEREILESFEALSETPWFLPSTPGGTRPKTELVFDVPASNVRGARATSKKGLKSKISYRGSVDNAYDGQNLTYFINDEVGKKQDYDPYARWNVIKKMLNPNGRQIIGKSLHMTTSDEEPDSEKAITVCKSFWYKSDQNTIGPNGIDPERPTARTKSGLFRLFVPAWEGVEPDEYGRDTPLSKQGFLDDRAMYAQDPIELLKEKRANPFSIEEAHIPSVKAECVVNAEHVGHTLSWLAQQIEPVVNRYDLEWIDSERTRVRAIQNNTSGRFYFSWIPPTEWLNQVEQVGHVKTAHGLMPKYKPLNAHRFGSGADPADHRDPEKLSGASKTALTGFYKYDEDMEARADEPDYWPSHSMVMEYAERMSDPDMYFEDVVKYIHLMGCSLFPETNRPGLANYVKARGYELFLSKRPASTQTEHTRNQKNTGAASSTLMIGRYTEEWVRFVSQYVGSELSKNSKGEVGINDEGLPFDPRRCPFERSLNKILLFDPNNTTKFDLAVSGGYGLCDITRYQPFAGSANALANGLSVNAISFTRLYV